MTWVIHNFIPPGYVILEALSIAVWTTHYRWPLTPRRSHQDCTCVLNTGAWSHRSARLRFISNYSGTPTSCQSTSGNPCLIVDTCKNIVSPIFLANLAHINFDFISDKTGVGEDFAHHELAVMKAYLLQKFREFPQNFTFFKNIPMAKVSRKVLWHKCDKNWTLTIFDLRY